MSGSQKWLSTRLCRKLVTVSSEAKRKNSIFAPKKFFFTFFTKILDAEILPPTPVPRKNLAKIQTVQPQSKSQSQSQLLYEQNRRECRSEIATEPVSISILNRRLNSISQIRKSENSPKNRRLSRQMTVDESLVAFEPAGSSNSGKTGIGSSKAQSAKSPIPNFEEISNSTILAQQRSIELELESQNNSPR